jgi:hypothetical protein
MASVLKATPRVEDEKTLPEKSGEVEASRRYPSADSEEPCSSWAGKGTQQSATLDRKTPLASRPERGRVRVAREGGEAAA